MLHGHARGSGNVESFTVKTVVRPSLPVSETFTRMCYHTYGVKIASSDHHASSSDHHSFHERKVGVKLSTCERFTLNVND